MYQKGSMIFITEKKELRLLYIMKVISASKCVYLCYATRLLTIIEQEDGEALSEAINEVAEVDHFQKVICPISTTLFTDAEVALPHIVEIAVSNNNEDYSEPKQVTVYDSRCWNCSSGCVQNVSRQFDAIFSKNVSLTDSIFLPKFIACYTYITNI